MMLRAAVIGCGVISHVHIPILMTMDGVSLAAVCDTNPAKKPDIDVPFYTDYETLYEEIRPNVVHICLPHYLHYPVSRFFAEKGVHVFCEKPAALNSAQLEEFIALEDAHPELKIGICFQNRLNDTTLKLKELLDSGEYGKVQNCFALNPWARDQSYFDAGPWRGDFKLSGGGCMINQAIHLIDLMGQFCGPVKSVKGSDLCLMDLATDVEDTAVCRMDFESGARGIFFATNANGYNNGPILEIKTEKAVFVIDSRRLYQLDEAGERQLITSDEVLAGDKFYYGSSHRKMIEKFYTAVKTGSDDYVHVRDARLSNRVIDAIYQSGDSGKEIVMQ